MENLAILVFSGLLIVELAGEYSAMARTGTLRKSRNREWTYYAMALPFKGMVIATLIEGMLSQEPLYLITLISGSLITVCGITIRVGGHLALDGAFSPYVQTNAGQKLVRSGMYSRIRHPMYLGSMLLFIGMPMTVAVSWAWIFSGLGVVGIIIRIQKEETFLKSTLEGYDEYSKFTWRLLPYVY